jgi:ADP-ribosyl-[dinitrogen reductase] hydrolase
MEDLRENYIFNETCQETVPQAIFTFLFSDNFEDSIRKAIYIGGDSDTLACINGSIAEAFYGGVPEKIKLEVFKRLDKKTFTVLDQFIKKYNI